ncbi:MAG TPA: ubiquinol-cytochrome c reductase iron-sulfur subunit [Caldithrix abyssi]|uniref:Ubiquinol-cytochrome c reductase iron-sulfur subunit n=1 Tax=Caldithrix abyssi TaxID=187145 RepID=A0A7V5H4W7_CALAY|nr:ubiquinol-cytochrome c reductase iron-sulfur subunit [Caldithrix abyssi]
MAEEDKKVNRREFFFKTGVFTALGLAILAFFRNLLLYIFPARKEKTFHKYLVAHEKEFKKDKRPKQINIGKTPVFVVPYDDHYKVMSGICTHLGCIVKWEQDKDRFFCPCHKGEFDRMGNVIGGPPPRPLDEFKVVVENHKVYVYVEDKVRSPWA